MAFLKALLTPFARFNDVLLPVGRWIAILLMGIMVAAILVQVFWRYVLNDALPWPEEAARFCMLWMTGLIAPLAYRRGGFVAIDMLVVALPTRLAAFLNLVLLAIALLVLAVALPIAWKDVTGFGGSFSTSSLKTFFAIDFADGFPWLAVDWGWQKMPKNQMSASLLVGVALLVIVNIELILRSLISLFGSDADLPPIQGHDEEMVTE